MIGFANTTLNTSEGVNAQICAQIKNGTLGRSVSVFVSTTALGTAIGECANVYLASYLTHSARRIIQDLCLPF